MSTELETDDQTSSTERRRGSRVTGSFGFRLTENSAQHVSAFLADSDVDMDQDNTESCSPTVVNAPAFPTPPKYTGSTLVDRGALMREDETCVRQQWIVYFAEANQEDYRDLTVLDRAMTKLRMGPRLPDTNQGWTSSGLT